MTTKSPELVQSVRLPLSKLETNKGQIEGLPQNPRFIRDEKFKKLVRSIEDNPEMTALREVLVYPHAGKYVIIGGNMRYQALKELGYKEAICKILPENTTPEQLQAYTIKDNAGFGEWDFDLLGNEWDAGLLDLWGVDVPVIDIGEEDEEEHPAKINAKSVIIYNVIAEECVNVEYEVVNGEIVVRHEKKIDGDKAAEIMRVAKKIRLDFI